MSHVEQIKERLNIVDVVSSYIKLEKAGSNFRARCPFHTEKTPSFFISPERNTYHCFGCNSGGDAFSFVEEIEGLDFKGALKILADKAGVELRPIDKGEKDEKERLHKILEEATIFFQIELTKNNEVLSYLYKRGISSATLKKFRVGFAPDGWSVLYDLLKSKSYSDSEMEKVGLVIIKGSSGRPYDRFRSRIMFPVCDNAGRVVAFSGRIFSAQGGSALDGGDVVVAKYINSPETVLYSKSNILYGYEKAKNAIRKEDLCIVVEGQMDLLASHQAGVENTVAISGTALTPWHIRIIKRVSSNIAFAFDADKAGTKALYKSALASLPQNISVEVISMPENSDPADIAFKDSDKWREYIKDRKNIILYFLSFLKNEETDTGNFRKKAGEIVLPLIKRIDNKIIQEHFVEEASNAMSISKEAVVEEMNKIVIDQKEEDTDKKDKITDTKSYTRKEVLENQIISIILWQESLKTSNISIQSTKETISVFSKDFEDKLKDIKESEKEEKIFTAEQYFVGRNIESEIDEIISDFKKEIIKEELKEESLRLREAEKNGDTKKASEILKRYQELSKHISN